MSGPSDLLLGKPPVEGIATVWGKRPEPRRTEGHPDRTYAMAMIYAVKADIELLGEPTCSICGKKWPCTACTFTARQKGTPPPQMVPDPDFAIPELGELADLLPNAWAGHDGRDTDKLIQGIKAATATVHQTQTQPPGETQ